MRRFEKVLAMTTDSTKTLLIEAARNGDAGALEQVLSICQPDIHRYAHRSCAGLNDVDDAVRDALWLVYRKLGTLHAAAALPQWLFQIVKRICLRYAAQNWRTNESLDSIKESALLAEVSDDALRLDLAAAIDSLPPPYRTIILLRDCQELTIKEIAATLDITSEAVKSRLHRARAMIKEYLAAEK